MCVRVDVPLVVTSSIDLFSGAVDKVDGNARDDANGGDPRPVSVWMAKLAWAAQEALVFGR
eukprot:6479444-Alexandrium_andersonii.AAC.1